MDREKFVYGVKNPSSWMDDCFGIGWENDITCYAPYQRYMPTQCRDDLGIPHKEHKQLSGAILKIIGLVIGPNKLTIALPEEGRQNFLEEIDRYIIPTGGSPRRYTVRDWQHLAGCSNWAFNVFPLLSPMLSNVYDQTSGIADLDKRIKVTRTVSAKRKLPLNLTDLERVVDELGHSDSCDDKLFLALILNHRAAENNPARPTAII
ncbi:hypothetical protein NP233_g66 [Leucocoprinus birnbaumii]|uniref:Uncharacterized protein n=1 Tax=Leucocoprinus birnbaumii TaxID=56174 RepID=A0AAD5YYV9_9AGAR|nr:hypothetical protein NP233_g66 [Leucocoprinus birnbaumii]